MSNSALLIFKHCIFTVQHTSKECSIHVNPLVPHAPPYPAPLPPLELAYCIVVASHDNKVAQTAVQILVLVLCYLQLHAACLYEIPTEAI